MAPNTQDVTSGVDEVLTTPSVSKKKKSPTYFGAEIKWLDTIGMVSLHIITVYGFFTFPFIRKIKTVLFELFMNVAVVFGATAGAHRLWTHRAYKAKWPLKIILLYCFYSSGQNSVYRWVRDHRVHHKYADTDADPHNSNRGFFFSHAGWLMMKKHPEVVRRGRQIDMSDIVSDPILAFGEKYFYFFKVFLCFVIPTIVPVYFWNEEWYYSFLATLMRYALSLNCTWSVNSVAHIWGYKPYDKSIAPVENKYVAFFAVGEGWHNYHHVFPYDYKCAELGNYSLNWTTYLIDMFAKIGWAYDLKQPSKELIQTTIQKRGGDLSGEDNCNDM